MGQEEPGDSQLPMMDEWGGAGVNNLHKFAIEKKAQRKKNIQPEI
jgi:hypothetical protein